MNETTRNTKSGITLEIMEPMSIDSQINGGAFKRKDLKGIPCSACKRDAVVRIIVRKFLGREGKRGIYENHSFYLCEHCADFLSSHLQIFINLDESAKK